MRINAVGLEIRVAVWQVDHPPLHGYEEGFNLIENTRGFERMNSPMG